MPLHFETPKSTFIHIPKNAGNSFEQWVIENKIQYENKFNHCNLTQARELWQDLGTVFSFVRNPFSRTVSIFHYLGQHAERKIREKRSVNLLDDLKTLNLYKKGFDYWLNCLFDENSEFNEKFEITNTNGESTWPRRAPQGFWFNWEKIDLVIKIEELDKEVANLRELFKIKSSSKIPMINTSDHKEYKTYYNKENVKIIRTMFEYDLNSFNYDF
jgi:hypothetical protein